MPFALYLLAEHVDASGVLAVLAVGLYLRTTATRQTTSAGWLLGRSVWHYVDFAVSGLLFGFLGIELTGVLRRTPDLGEPSTWTLTAAVVVALVVVRAAAVFTASGLAGRRARRRGSALPAGWRESAVASWAGMRGVVTVATALALPGAVSSGAAFPQRDVVVVIALVVVLVTLVLQGLTLSPLIQKLGVASEVDPSVDVRHLHRLAAQAAVQRLEEAGDDVPEDVRRAVLAQYRSRLDYRTAVEDLVEGSGAGPRLRELLSAASDAERDAVARARRSGEVSPAAADEVLFDIQAPRPALRVLTRAAQRGSRRRGNPPRGRRVTEASTTGVRPGTGSARRSRSSAASTSTASVRAKSLPMQSRAPAPNGR